MVTTRESLRAVACYVLGPARHARDGHIGLRPHDGGVATPVLEGDWRIGVRGARLRVEPDGTDVELTTVRAAAALVGVELRPDPPVGHDLPPFEPDRPLDIDAGASLQLGRWWALGDEVLAHIRTGRPVDRVSPAQLWPEHFDLAVTLTLRSGGVNVGFSPGDAWHDGPYAYVGPHDVARLDRRDPYWNAPFGAVLDADGATTASAVDFVEDGLRRADA